MPRSSQDLNPGAGRPLLDLVSYGRRGVMPEDRLSPFEVQHIARTVGRTPEVMVKVTGGGKTKAAAVGYLQYIDRRGELEIETDAGDVLKGPDVAEELATDWDLDTAAALAGGPYSGRSGRKPVKLVHNVVLSMPVGTPPLQVLIAARAFAREQFAFKHRYALVLHTDQGHPHVHLAIKAVSEQGSRLNIRKATLREWRQQFAHHLREQGIAANSTERAVRGASRTPIADGAYRASQRGESLRLPDRAEQLSERVQSGGEADVPGKSTLLKTRAAVVSGWRNVADVLAAQGHADLAKQVRAFVNHLPPPLTDDERLVKASSKATTDPPEPRLIDRSR